MAKTASRISGLLEDNEKYRSGGLNLIASENVVSPKVKSAFDSELEGRYHAQFYGGTKYVHEIIKETEGLFKKLFNAKHAIVTPLSGNLCDLAVLFGLTSPGDKFASLSFDHGGYPLGFSKFDRIHVPLPAVQGTFSVDVDGTVPLLEEKHPEVVMLGSSYIPFPHPAEEMRRAIDSSEATSRLVYDGSHVLGLMACGQFQDPLREGCEVLFGSTHKSFYGPQGGVVMTNDGELDALFRKYLEMDISGGIGLVDNPHPARIAALGIAAEEMLSDPDYGKNVVKNARTLARALVDLGVPVRFQEEGYTDSHQIFLDYPEAEAEKLCHSLEECHIFIDIGGRLGVCELTHLGMGPTEMDSVAELIKKAMDGDDPRKIRKGVIDLRRDFQM